jgi:hypothetical protein
MQASTTTSAIDRGSSSPKPDRTFVQMGLDQLDSLWPTREMVERYRSLADQLQQAVAHCRLDQCSPVLGSAIKALADSAPDHCASADGRQARSALREASAFGSMLMHLRPELSAGGNFHFRNQRRNRRPYTTYPTAPRIGASIARYTWRILARRPASAGSARILDPTMEGGPLLLEMAFEAARRARTGLAPRADRPIRPLTLCGIDQNPVAAPFVRKLLGRAITGHGAGALDMDIRTGEALDLLEKNGPLQAIVNNPPWGAATDGANIRGLEGFGPFSGYRDPYIAYVATGLRKLEPGAPFGFVLPFQILTAPSAARLREELLENAVLDVICHLPRSTFPRLTTRTVMILGRRARNGLRRRGPLLVRYPMTRRIGDVSEPSVDRLRACALREAGSAAWVVAARSEPEALLGPDLRRLDELASVFGGLQPYGRGRGRPPQTSMDVERRPYSSPVPGPGRVPALHGCEIRRFRTLQPSEYVSMGPWLAIVGRQMELLDEPRVFVREICGRNGELVAAPAPAGAIAMRSVLTISCRGIAPDLLCAILNSAAVAGHVRTRCAGYFKESFGRISPADLRALPIPPILAEREGGRAGEAARRRLKQAVARAAGAQERGQGGGEAMSEIDRLIDAAYSP